MAESAEPIIALLAYVLRLKRLPRTGWLHAGVAVPESVADHSLGTALFTCFIGEAVNAGGGEPAAPVVDVGRAVRMAIVHDLAESIVTDLPREATEVIGRDAKHAAEGRAMQRLLQDVPGGEDTLGLWREYVGSASPEAKLVRDADKLEMVMQARHYASSGNTNLAEFWQGHEWFFAESRALFDQLMSEA